MSKKEKSKTQLMKEEKRLAAEREKRLMLKSESHDKRFYSDAVVPTVVSDFVEEKRENATTRTIANLIEKENEIEETLKVLDNNLENEVNDILNESLSGNEEYSTDIDVEEKIKEIREAARKKLEETLSDIRNKKETIISKQRNVFDISRSLREDANNGILSAKSQYMQSLYSQMKNPNISDKRYKELKNEFDEKESEYSKYEKKQNDEEAKIKAKEQKELDESEKEYTVTELNKEGRIRFEQYKAEYGTKISAIEEKLLTPTNERKEAQKQKAELDRKYQEYVENLEKECNLKIKAENKAHRKDKNYTKKKIVFSKNVLDLLEAQMLDEKYSLSEGSKYLYLNDQMKKSMITTDKELFSEKCLFDVDQASSKFYNENILEEMNAVNQRIQKASLAIEQLEKARTEAKNEFEGQVETLNDEVQKKGKDKSVRPDSIEFSKKGDIIVSKNYEVEQEEKSVRKPKDEKSGEAEGKIGFISKIKTKLSERKERKEKERKDRINAIVEKRLASMVGNKNVETGDSNEKNSLRSSLSSQVKSSNEVQYTSNISNKSLEEQEIV